MFYKGYLKETESGGSGNVQQHTQSMRICCIIPREAWIVLTHLVESLEWKLSETCNQLDNIITYRNTGNVT